MEILELYFRLMFWWLRRWYPIFRWFGRLTSQEEYIERAIDVTEDNFKRIIEGDENEPS